MVIRNNVPNRRLAAQIGEAIESELGFSAIVDKNWNCRKDIRIEIAVIGMDAPFIIASDLHADGRFEIKLVMIVREMTLEQAQWMHCLLEGFERIAARVQELITEAKPMPSYYAGRHAAKQL